jgi:shikimate kinase
MGVGKSTIGKVLAHELNVPFFDTDRVIENRTGADIPWIFDVEGEAGFRLRETQVLQELTAKAPSVIATGGGIVTQPENAKLLACGLVCYLTASVEQLVERTSRDKKRPLLQVDNPREKIIQILTEREPLYRAVADVQLNTDRLSPKSVVACVLEHL